MWLFRQPSTPYYEQEGSMRNKIKKLSNKLLEEFKKNAKDPSQVPYEESTSSAQSSFIVCAALAVLVFVLYYRLSHDFCTSEGLQDIKAHADFALNFYLNPEEFLKAWLRVPHMLWHLIVKFFQSRVHMPLWEAASFTYALFGVFSYAVTTWFLYALLRTYTTQKRLGLASLGSASLAIVGPLVMEWFADGYMGQFTPNPMHNPTHMACKGFGLLAMMTGIDIIRHYRGQEAVFFKGKKLYLYFGLFAFFSTLAKPTFMYMLLPAGIIVILLDLLKSARKKTPPVKTVWNAAWKLAVATLPTCAYLLTEYVAIFFFGREQGASVVLTKPLEVWHFFSLNVPKSILLGMCFPIWMLLTNLCYFYKTVEGRLSVLGYLIGVLEFSVLAESGDRKDAGNFAWCMMAGMTIFFAVSVCRLMLSTMQQERDAKHITYVIFSWFLLFLHVYSGLSLYNIFGNIL